MSLVWDTKRYFTSAEKLVLLKIADCAADDGSHAYPSHNYIASECSLSRRAVIKILNRLYDDGIVSKQTRYEPEGDQTSNYYTINVELLKQIANNARDCEQVVHKPCITRAQPVRGSERGTRGVVNHVHGGSELRSPNTSIDPSYDPSNNIKGAQQKNFKEDEGGILAIQIVSALRDITPPPDKSLTQLSKEVLYFVQTRNQAKYKEPKLAINVAKKLIREDRWTTPRGME